MPGLIFGFLLLTGSCELLGKESLAALGDRLPTSNGRTPPGFKLAELMEARRDMGLVKYRLADLGKVMVNNLSRRIMRLNKWVWTKAVRRSGKSSGSREGSKAASGQQ